MSNDVNIWIFHNILICGSHILYSSFISETWNMNTCNCDIKCLKYIFRKIHFTLRIHNIQFGS